MNLFEEQLSALKSVLDTQDETERLSAWKVLVLDDETLGHVTYFKVGDLRQMNVALHLHIAERKERLPGVKAVYLIAPSPGSIAALLADLAAGIFEEVWLNFSRPITRAELDGFCEGLMRQGTTAAVRAIRQFYFPCYPLHEACFTLRSSVPGDVIGALTGLCLGLRARPVFAFPERSTRCRELAEGVLGALGAESPYFLPAEMAEGQLLILLSDGAADLLPNLVHSLGYAQAVSDCYGPWGGGARGGEELPGQVDLRGDRFFAQHFLAELPAAALALAEELTRYKDRFAALEAEPQGGPEALAEHLSDKLDKLPEMTELRKRNKLHTALCSAVMKRVAETSQDRYAELAGQALRSRSFSKDQLAETLGLLRQPTGRVEDKLRLFAVASLCDACGQKELRQWADLIAPAASPAQKAFLEKAVGERGAAGGGYLSAFADSGKKLLQTRLGSGFGLASARLLLDLFRRRETPEGLVLLPTGPVSPTAQIVCLNLVGGSFLELAELLEAGRQLGKRVWLGVAELLAPAAALQRYIELSR